MGFNNSDVVGRANIFSLRKHLVRGESLTSLHGHIAETAELVRTVGGSDVEQAAAWLHAVIGSTEVSIEDIRYRFSDAIANIVEGLASPKDYKYLPILNSRLLEAERIKTMNESVKLVKLACITSELLNFSRGYYLSWSVKDQEDLLGGTYLIAISCFGVNQSLDSRFYKAYLEAGELLNDLRPLVKGGRNE